MAASERPNIILILADDMGFSDIGCYGSEIRTPNIDRLAKNGLRFTQFYNCARCCPSRAALMTGLYPHQAWVGDMVDEYARPAREQLKSRAYSDHLNPYAPTIAEALHESGYRTGMSGKWHLGYRTNEWPCARGFARSFAVIEGAMNYYGFGMQHTGAVTNPPMALDKQVYIPPREGFFSTDAFTEYAVSFIKEAKTNRQPFFLYLAYNAPHWPLHARLETIAHYRGKYKTVGWDKLRERRHERLKELGLIDGRWPLAPRPPQIPAWEQATAEQQLRWDEQMSIYAAQVEEMDAGVGKVLQALKKIKADENTLILFLSDNGGASEDPNRSLPEARLGTRESYKGYGLAGAHVSSSPFRKTKKFTHEGGISPPFIASWPEGIAMRSDSLVRQPAHIIDLMPTCLAIAGATFPKTMNGESTTNLEGVNLTPAFQGKDLARTAPLFWEHEGHRAIRDGKWKLVASHNDPWELYDIETDRTELHDLSKTFPEKTRELVEKYSAWSERVGVKPWPEPQTKKKP